MGKPKIAVLGSGSWGTAIVKIITDNKLPVCWYVREPEIISSIKEHGHNPVYLSSVRSNNELIHLTNDINEAITSSDHIILAIPATFLSESLKTVSKSVFANKLVISAVKGIIPGSNQIIADYFGTAFNLPVQQFVVVSGPSHAEEIALEKLTYLTVASQSQQNANQIAGYFNCRYVKASVSDDIYGTEYSSVLKNIVALANGICIGLGYGDNFQAALVANAIQEIKRFVDAVHPIDRDINSSVYLGDLIVTAYSQFSRNRTFGNMIGKGYSVTSAHLEMKMIAEGYYAAKCIWEINKKFNVDMPITEAVHNILYLGKNPAAEIHLLSTKIS